MGKEVSILMPVYNEERHIRQILSSLCRQDYPKELYEILIIDGYSTDKTVEIVNEFINAGENIKLLYNEKKIQAAGLNAGLHEAGSRYILRADGHCTVPQNYVSLCVQLMDAKNIDYLSFNMRTEAEGFWQKVISIGVSHIFGVGNSQYRVSGKEGSDENGFLGGYRRDKLLELNGFNEEMVVGEDFELAYRFRKAGMCVYRSSLLTISYFPRNSIKGLFRQYFTYGYYKAKFMLKNRTILRLRHIIPSAFVVLVLLGILALFIEYPFSLDRLFAGTLASYGLINMFYSIRSILKKDIYQILALSFTFLTLHISYGAGFLFYIFINPFAIRIK